jgi:exodeoxyribonuclease VII large subunit
MPESTEQLSAPKVYSVYELTASVRRMLENSLGAVCVEGEISGYRMQPSGHQYFTLKDAKAQVACVWFAGRSSGRAVPLSDGMAVQIRGTPTVYEAQGKFQISVQSVQAAGAGLLQAKFEALKRRLQEEGLFDSGRKRALPRFPQTVALLTSPTGSVVQDMLKVLGRRAPWVRVLVYPAKVQGQGAAEEIAAGLAFLNAESGRSLPTIDVIISGRGGGSIEDLWCFNEEIVARALYASAIPVVSAVGHETDFTISDFVADHRAATPSVAAEMVVPDGQTLGNQVRSHAQRIENMAHRAVRALSQRLDFLAKSALFREPRNRLSTAAQHLDGATEALGRALRDGISERRSVLERLAASVREHRPDQVLALRRQQLEGMAARLSRSGADQMRRNRADLERMGRMLVLLSPEGTLERGYSITFNGEGALVRSVEELQSGARMVTRFKDGRVESEVRSVGKLE